METMRWGILSTGRIADKFASQLPHSRTGSLVAVASREVSKARTFARKHKVARACGAYDELLADPEVDAVYVCTPHPHHAEWAIAAAEAGKHILCEKPLTLNHAEAMAVVEAARRSGVLLMEAFMYRCHPNTNKACALLAEGAIGKVRLIEAAFSFKAACDPTSRLYNTELGGGGILDVGCYTTSVARLFAGAASGKAFEDPADVHGAMVPAATGVDAIAAATLRFPSGILAQLSCGVGLSTTPVVRVFGEEGSLIFHDFWTATSRVELRRCDKEPELFNEQGGDFPYALEADAVADALPALETEAVPILDTLGNMRTLDRWRESAGLVYPMELPERQRTTVSRRTLRPGRFTEIPAMPLPGVEGQVSVLAMGMDNQTTAPHLAAIADDFIERGGNLFDTAYIYGGGLQERLLGQYLKARGLRPSARIIVKGAHTPFCTPEHLISQLHTSLERLHTDHADIYMMHRDNPDVPVGEFVDAMDGLRTQGLVKVFGGSNWSLDRIREANAYAAAAGRAAFSVVSNNFSLAKMLEPVWEGCISASGPGWRDFLIGNPLVLLAWSSQARGFFLDEQPPGWAAGNSRSWDSEENLARRARARELAQEKGVSTLQIALAYVLNQPFRTVALIGPRSINETRTSVPGASLSLSPEEIAWLEG
jgi:predicted dehydrogenase/aryl-alcohol dehydrogenase-like predicted oxidoreductase